MSGTRISDMTALGSLPASGATIPVVKTGDETNYGYDLATDLAGRPTSADLLADTGFTLIKYKSSQSDTYARTAAALALLGGSDDSNIFHHIPPDLDDAILDGSITDDLYTYLQNALNQGGLKRFAGGLFPIATALDVLDNALIAGQGKDTILQATSAHAFSTQSKSNFTIRDMKVTPLYTGAGIRGGFNLIACANALLKNIIVEGQTDGDGAYMWDCDHCIIDGLYYDGGSAAKNGTAVYASGCQDCKQINSHAINCFAGFTWSGYDIDSDINPLGVAARTSAQTYGNGTANCTVRNCTTQSFDVNSSSYNTFTNCHAEDYAGAGSHKAFQAKDPAGDGTRGNSFIGCTVKNYPAGFGAQQTSHTKFIGCTGRDLTTNGIELNSVSRAEVIGCSFYEYQGAGIWLGSGTICSDINHVKLETSTATATGILFSDGAGNSNNSFDNVTTLSTLASFITVPSGNNNTRFGPGLKPNNNAITDSSGASVWPCVYRTDIIDLTSSGSLQYATSMVRGMHVAVAKFVVTLAVTGSPQVSAGVHNSTGLLAGNQNMTATLLGATQSLTLAASPFATAGLLLTGRVGAVATAGKGFIQFEGLPLA